MTRKHSRAIGLLLLLMITLFVAIIQTQRNEIKELNQHLMNHERELERYQSIIQTKDEAIKILEKQMEEYHINMDQHRLEVQELQEILNQLTVQKFKATAYTHVAVAGVADINGTGDGITRSGLPVREGLIAVDPSVIPLGSKVWVDGFGVLLAADTGGAIKGNRIDIFFDDRQEALNWGVQDVIVRRVEM